MTEEKLGTSWHSYPKIYNLGHAYIGDLFKDPVIVQEKVDGSQFSFGVFNGELKARSKGQQLIIDAPEKLFSKAIETIKELQPLLIDGWTYRGEYLTKPKHNALAYDRVPLRHIILFDINLGEESYLPYEKVKEEANRLGLEVVPLLSFGIFQEAQVFKELLERVSCLGGQKIEGVVVKNYGRFGLDKKVLMGKHVSEAFKEVHKGEWRKDNPGKADILDMLGTKYRTPARWAKAVQHLRENGFITDTPADIGKLIGEVQADVEAECGEEIKQVLYHWAMPKISRALIRGLPEWYKQQLMEKQFANG